MYRCYQDYVDCSCFYNVPLVLLVYKTKVLLGIRLLHGLRVFIFRWGGTSFCSLYLPILCFFAGFGGFFAWGLTFLLGCSFMVSVVSVFFFGFGGLYGRHRSWRVNGVCSVFG